MIGYYDATHEDVEDTIKFAAGLGLDWASFSRSRRRCPPRTSTESPTSVAT